MVATCLVITASASDNNPPRVVITNPSFGQTFAGLTHIMIAADASDSDGYITNVEFAVNGETLYADNSYPYHIGTAFEPGLYSITVTATDNSGNQSFSSVQVAVLKRPVTGLGTIMIGANPEPVVP